PRRTHAVVIGGRGGGLLGGRGLSGHVGGGAPVEGGRLPGGGGARRGGPQGRPGRGRLGRGGQEFYRPVPDLMAALRDAGATMVDRSADMRWYHFGGYSIQFPSGAYGPICSRPLLERELRRRVLALANVSALDQHGAVELLVSEDQSRVT